MAAALSDAQIAEIEAQLTARPEILQAIQANQQKLGGKQRFITKDPRFMQQGADLLKQYGINFPDVQDYQIQVDPSGRVKLNRVNWLQRNLDWVVPVAAIGGGAAAGGVFSGGGAGVPTTTNTATGLDAVGLGPSGLPLANVPPSLVAPVESAGGGFAAGPIAGTGIEGGNTAELATTMAASKGPSLLHSLLPTIIGAGAQVGGTAIAAHANTEAAKIAADQADKALALEKEQYALQRQDTAPYRALGQGAVGNLGYLSGINLDQGAIDKLAASTPTVPYGQTAPQFGGPELGGTNTGVATGQHSVLVPVKNPATGLVHLIPNNQVNAAISAGGQLANRGA